MKTKSRESAVYEEKKGGQLEEAGLPDAVLPEIPPASSPETVHMKEIVVKASEERTAGEAGTLSEEKSTGGGGTLSEEKCSTDDSEALSKKKNTSGGGTLSEERSVSDDGALSEERSISEEVEEHRTVVQLEEVMSGDDNEAISESPGGLVVEKASGDETESVALQVCIILSCTVSHSGVCAGQHSHSCCGEGQVSIRGQARESHCDGNS